MPYKRPTLTELKNQVAQDLSAAGSMLRFSNLAIVGKAQANLSNLEYGYLDWISKQSNPYTAEDEFLEAWAALKNVFRNAATQATGKATFTGIAGKVMPIGTQWARTDGKTFTTTEAGTVGIDGTVEVSAVADEDPSGLLGAFGNTLTGTQMALTVGIPGIQPNGVVSVAFTGGADLEDNDSLRSRMLQAYQNQPQGGSQSDYDTWALQVPGVTRVWTKRNGMGVGTVVVFFMMDAVRSGDGGFPQGTNGISQLEERSGTVADGDQLIVADHIYPLQPVTALVYACAPGENSVDFDIDGVDVGQQAAVTVALADLLYREGVPGGTIPLAHVWSAVESAVGNAPFLIVNPATDIVSSAGYLPMLGTLTWL